MRFIILIFISLPYLCQAQATEQHNQGSLTINPPKSLSVSIGIYLISFDKYKRYLTGDICQKLTPDFSKEQIDRSIINLMFICQAFEQLEVPLDITIVPYPNNQRGLAMLEAGDIDTIADVIGPSDIKKRELYTSIDIIRNGEFEKGIYVHEEHPILNKPQSEIQLNQYTGITMPAWIQDWTQLSKLTNKTVPLRHLPSLFLLLKTRRADFTLMSFPAADNLDFVEQDITLKPIPGIKVIIPESRQFVVSKRSKNGDAYFSLLNKGLTLLRQQGIIVALFRQGGFFNAKTADWTILNKDVLNSPALATKKRTFNN